MTGEPEFDAIVIGSGPAGATVARELSKRGQRVLVLERGSDGPLGESLVTTAKLMSVVRVNENLVTPRAFATGGTTAVYFAVADLPPLDTFLSLGVDLSRELEEAQRELPLSILPDELIGAQAQRVRQSAMELGYTWRKSTMLVDLSKCANGYAYEAKWNARSYLQEAIGHGATLITRARVMKILIENGQAVGVEYRLRIKKKEFEVRQAFGTKIVLAAGGAASPILLRESGLKNVANGGFYCHPGFAVFGLVPGLKAGDNFVGSMGMDVEDGVGIGDANLAKTRFRTFMIANRRFIRAFSHARSIGVGVMVKEGLGGELTEDGRYYKQLEREDLAKLEKGAEIARRIIGQAGGKHIFSSRPVAGHIGGTLKFGEHIDGNLQTEIRNLYVCDGSVIPDRAKVSPTLTLICLAKYLANRLAPAH